MKWSKKKIPQLSGKTIVVTGANSGLGYETTRILANKGARVIMACRNLDKAETARNTIFKENSKADLEIMHLDLADLSSVRKFAEEFNENYPQLDILYNNAGLMAIPYRQTKDGFEMTIGVDHLGHFALTGLLLPKLIATNNSRVVTVSSVFHYMGKIDFDDLMYDKRKYWKWGAYARAKLANLLFAFELQRKFDEYGITSTSTAAHPGWGTTELQTKGNKMEQKKFREKLVSVINYIFGYAPKNAVLPQIRAGVDHSARGGDYFGPLIGNYLVPQRPVRVWSTPRAKNKVAATKLWEISEDLTGVKYDFSKKI